MEIKFYPKEQISRMPSFSIFINIVYGYLKN